MGSDESRGEIAYIVGRFEVVGGREAGDDGVGKENE